MSASLSSSRLPAFLCSRGGTAEKLAAGVGAEHGRGMSFHAPSMAAACVVCGSTDARALCTTRLASGEEVVVCGTHELMHRRSRSVAASTSELAEIVRDRRDVRERRRDDPDELGAQLIAAFRTERRRTPRR